MRKSLVLLAILMLLTGCASGEAAESEALPTNTPNATATRTPRPTETPGPTPTPQTSPPDAPPLSEVSENSDGSLSYSRFDHGYQITFPSNWVIYELTESESREFLSMAAEEIPEFEDLFDFSALYSQGIHLIAYDFDPDHYVN